MRAESVSLVSTFETELEKLGGKFYVASDANEIADRILKIASQNNCVNIVKQRINIDNEEHINQFLVNHGFTIVGLEEASDPISILNKADVAVTRADMLIAETGTLVASTHTDITKLASCLPRIHVVIALEDDIVRTHHDATAYLRKQFESPGSVSFISGPSRTADIEMKLILGVHGPHQVHVIILKK